MKRSSRHNITPEPMQSETAGKRISRAPYRSIRALRALSSTEHVVLLMEWQRKVQRPLRSGWVTLYFNFFIWKDIVNSSGKPGGYWTLIRIFTKLGSVRLSLSVQRIQGQKQFKLKFKLNIDNTTIPVAEVKHFKLAANWSECPCGGKCDVHKINGLQLIHVNKLLS